VRRIQVFIVRIIQDENEPGALRGEIRSVASGEVCRFSNGQGMISLLQDMQCSSTTRDSADNIAANQNNEQVKIASRSDAMRRTTLAKKKKEEL
jgi:hypothetical protein